jgi:hypothetical protein
MPLNEIVSKASAFRWRFVPVLGLLKWHTAKVTNRRGSTVAPPKSECSYDPPVSSRLGVDPIEAVRVLSSAGVS